VIAKSQERAAKVANRSARSIRKYYDLEDGDWWHRYAEEESVWSKVGGQYVKMLSREEAKAILKEELAKYEAMPLEQLAGLTGHQDVVERDCSSGSPVKVTVTACWYNKMGRPVIQVGARIQDRSDQWEHFEREADCTWHEMLNKAPLYSTSAPGTNPTHCI
jgi:hypothetical protein